MAEELQVQPSLVHTWMNQVLAQVVAVSPVDLTPADKLAGLDAAIFAERVRKLEEVR